VAYDVIVVGGGNAAMCSALSAREHGARVLVLEKAPEAWRGGNGFFTAGGFRFGFKSFDDLAELVPDLSDQEKASMEVDPYTAEQFYDDLMRVTEECADPDMAMLLVSESLPTVRWMRDRGVRWIPMFGRQAYKVGGKFRFWGGLVLEAVGGGAGLIDMEYQSAAKNGIDVRFESKATKLVTDDRGAVTGVVVRTPAGSETIDAGAVVLASGGFEANPEMRTRYLGPNWELARVRGTPYNTGDGIKMALEIGALPWGHWSGCHSVQWDLNAPWHGDRKVVPARAHREPQGRALRRRGRRLPQLHLREIRARGHRPAATHRIPDLRPEGAAQPARGVSDPRGHQGRGHDPRGARAQARDRRRRIRRDDPRLQRVPQGR
jgi:tricarballylate dehydrogenase